MALSGSGIILAWTAMDGAQAGSAAAATPGVQTARIDLPPADGGI
jgi:hypothetical protein